ncbi:MAG TPA: DUF488 family protein [Terriglobales bacterium]|nr:DUF488 family protein [Terriglobales bacterium]
MSVATKRVYEKPVRSDGARVLVDRLWPRGLRKEAALVHAWLKGLAPSDVLCRWLRGQPERWQDFRKRYLKELAHPDASSELEALYQLVHTRKRVTLVFASKDKDHNNAVVLKELLDGMRKPPSSSGSGAALSMRRRQRARSPQ